MPYVFIGSIADLKNAEIITTLMGAISIYYKRKNLITNYSRNLG